MPGYDGTGPRGLGPGTGWGLGPCGAGGRSWFGRGGWFGFGRGGWGRGFGRRPWGWGMGRGGGWWRGGVGPAWYGAAPYNPSPAEEAQSLRQEETYLKSELEAIQKRLAELEAASSS